MATSNTNHKSDNFISNNWMWFVGGAILIGFIILMANSNSNAPNNEDYLRSFTSVLMRYEPLQKYDETKRESIISCIYYSSNLISYRDSLRQQNQANGDHLISTYIPVPDEDIITSLNKYVDGDSSALLQEERNILSQGITDCTK